MIQPGVYSYLQDSADACLFFKPSLAAHKAVGDNCTVPKQERITIFPLY